MRSHVPSHGEHGVSQYLDEDNRTNRIDDSLQIFTQICSHQLLKKVHMVLFLSTSRAIRGGLRLTRLRRRQDRPSPQQTRGWHSRETLVRGLPCAAVDRHGA